ncbi:hypothetical protein J7W19_32370 [Streptomyces mobaraensis NBRC 13819 = DSM 40847]|uniref:Uncharacterized protein n=1 Tax=Streptomyces mobaraensis (strain ATCC 29032 / DSM 40847 / JCM 4168 / NBRC 13819 / NCIMB 11159 / IPCR 16-22) TaxID=1223523 RepID=M2ZUX6_STRM1|nr:hypothetical protein [Streptomyces mobaraensis]EME96533.1 hypothetical protein H340_31058 [Streptomyces mobaraensis NBRC 13819 = DSM 40847]QTT77450.1 hypothetical protein J7W19_32370 [Streptomyces mobaraensis NBRC 13819 = DSM 40847]
MADTPSTVDSTDGEGATRDGRGPAAPKRTRKSRSVRSLPASCPRAARSARDDGVDDEDPAARPHPGTATGTLSVPDIAAVPPWNTAAVSPARAK